MKNYNMKKQAGFTLVEFIVAMGVTLVVLGGATLAFKDAVRTNQHVTMHEDMNENMRAGMNLMQQDFILAGSGIPTGGIVIPATSDKKPNACNIGQPINRPGPDPTGASVPSTSIFFNYQNTCSFSLPAIEPGADLGPLVTSPDSTPATASDMITVLYADNTLPLSAKFINTPAIPTTNPPTPACNGTISASGDSVTFDTNCVDLSKAGIVYTPGDLILFNNSSPIGYALQAVTKVQGQTLSFAAGDPYHLNQRTDPSGTIQQIQNTTCLTDANGVTTCTPLGTYPATTATRVWMITYYLDNQTDPAHVRLVRRVNFRPGQPVGETLENLQFAYNYIDGTNTPPTGQSGVPTGYSENQIRSANVFVAARSTYPDPSTNKYLRDSLTTQVSFRSMAFVNKYK